MMDDRPAASQPDPEAGLCARCRHAEVVVNDRGSRFVRCGLSRSDPRFPRYPPLPVLRCAGFRDRDAIE